MTESFFDFHLHTRASDGAFEAGAALELARDAGLAGVSITDHDTLDAYGSLDAGVFATFSDATPRVLPGVEISTRLGEEEAHILGYFPEGFTPELREYMESILKSRRDRISEGIVKLRERGIDISLSDCERCATGRVVSRSVVAEVLVQKRYIGRAHRAYPDFVGPRIVPLPDEGALEAIERVRKLGGISVWAHPGSKQVDTRLPELREAGLEGVEVLIPRRRDAERQELAKKTRAAGLLVTGGSDWHGKPKGPDLGRFKVSGGSVEEFLCRIGWILNADRASERERAPR